MNNRILDLFEDAGGYCSKFDDGSFQYILPDLEKFVESIVRRSLSDCESVKDQFYNGVISTNDPKLKELCEHAIVVCNMVKNLIEIRFGVEG